jgi:hypothetical protein
MKTNHRRGYKAPSHTDNAMWHESRKDPLSETTVFAGISNDFSNGRRGEAKAKRGAKKFLNSRIRARQKAAVRKVASQENED